MGNLTAYYTDSSVVFLSPQCRRMVSSGIVEVIMELSIGQSDSFFTASVQGGKHADVEGFILPVSRPAICGARQPLLSFPLSSVGKPASDIWFPQAQAERK
mgnify:CR=1 FL=1